MSNLWWHNLPQCKVGDLVKYVNGGVALNRPLLVIKVNPKKPCRVNPCQYVTVFDSTSGRTSVFDAKKLEVISESR